MSNTHTACYMLEMRLREEVQRLEDTIEDMREDMQDLQYELDNCNTPPPIQEETEAEADYRKAREKLDDEITAAELAALTAPENLDMRVRQWLRDNPPPPTPTIPEHIKQLQGRVFSDYMTTIVHPEIDPQTVARRYGADNMRAYEIMHAEALNRAKIAAAINAQAEANAELSKALRNATA